ncbi:flavin reductase family protein [Paenibacillus sp. N1-5-1-14]|uniref:flavin reductase family protein n=1 Tax=Paenibacillus radicibacter TaxID=2972488 RepID=UPI0021590435|nr:flavin reductase family protein [Paenibacillus radicibacter]MCR8643998.1 flavin reductase family protein [Paenibacillus radicibacter]
MDDQLFKKAMGKFATGVTVITTECEGVPYGMTANAFMSVSLDPKLVLVSVAHKASMFQRLEQSKKYAVNILSSEQQEYSMIFANQLKKEVEFAYLDGFPVLNGALAIVKCDLVAAHEAGDHTLFIGQVTDIELNEGEPLLYASGKYRVLSGNTESMD